MKSFQTQNASWVLKGGVWTITRYKGSNRVAVIELTSEDLACAIEQLARLAKKEEKRTLESWGEGGRRLQAEGDK